jgi:hypothetical protein
MIALTLRLSEDVHVRAAQKAQQTDTSLAAYIRQLIADDLERRTQVVELTFPKGSLDILGITNPIQVEIRSIN